MEQSYVIRNDRVIGKTVPNINYNYSTCPIGSIFAFSSERIPLGFFICDGASYKVAEYPDLYAVIGNTYGGDGTNFNVPNLVDKFIQGSTTSGTEKEAGLPNIEGRWDSDYVYSPYFEGTFEGAFYRGTASGQKTYTPNSQGSGIREFLFDASKSNAIYGNSDTVQPPALTMVYIIKAKHTNEGVDSGVSDDVVEYVDGEIAKVETELNANLGELCNKKIYCGEVTGTTVNGFIGIKNPIGKSGNVIATMKYQSNLNAYGYCVTAQSTELTINFYFRWHRESDDAEAYPPDGTEITISYMIFY